MLNRHRHRDGSEGRRDEGAPDRRLFYALLMLLVWLPLPLGSNRVWAMALMQLAVTLLALAWLHALRGRAAAPALGTACPVLVLLGLWLGFGLLQLLPWPRALAQLVSPALVAQQDSVPGGMGDWVVMTLDPHASIAHWFGSLTLTMVFVLTLGLVRSRRRLRLLARVLVLAAVLQATLAGLVALIGQDLWFIEGTPAAHGTYANRNHLAGFLIIGLALGIGLLVSELDEDPGERSWRQHLRDIARTLLGPAARLRLYLAIMVIVLVMTGSRMGNMAFFASLGIASLIGLTLWRRASRGLTLLLISLLLIDVLILGSWFGLDRVRERITQTVLAEETRWQLDIQAGDYIRDYLITGSGGGTFPVVFPAYRHEILVPRLFLHAHNDFLEMQLEYGIIGSALLAATVLLSLLTAIRVMHQRQDPLLRGMAFTAIMGISGILIHGLADFNLRIPANAALFMVLLALPWLGLSFGSRRQDEHRADRPGERGA